MDWLLEGEAYIQYHTRLDLLGQAGSDPQVSAARRAMLEQPQVQALIQELGAWPWKVIASHKSAGQPFHKLAFLADLGLQRNDPGMEAIIQRVLEHQSAEGPFQLSLNIPVHYGGEGVEKWGWALCDAPIVAYALARFGLAEDPQVKKARAYLAGLVRENGWPCTVCKELGNFRGPGRKADPCPYATLVMLKLLAQSADRDSQAARIGAETLLDLWQTSREQHPYMFFMGDDFRKLKVPLVWYDLLHVLEVLTRFPWLEKDARLQSMLALLEGKADAQGRFSLEFDLDRLEGLGIWPETRTLPLADALRLEHPAALRRAAWELSACLCPPACSSNPVCVCASSSSATSPPAG